MYITTCPSLVHGNTVLLSPTTLKSASCIHPPQLANPEGYIWRYLGFSMLPKGTLTYRAED